MCVFSSPSCTEIFYGEGLHVKGRRETLSMLHSKRYLVSFLETISTHMPLAWITFCVNSISWLVDYKVWLEKNGKRKKIRLLNTFWCQLWKYLLNSFPCLSTNIPRACFASISLECCQLYLKCKFWLKILGVFCFGSLLSYVAEVTIPCHKHKRSLPGSTPLCWIANTD